MSETEKLILAELRALRSEIQQGKALAKPAAKPFTVSEFAKRIRRQSRFVSDRCRTGKIKTLPGKPYRIIPGELEAWLALPK